LSDALATSICNSTVGDTPQECVEAGIHAAEKYSEVRGALIIVRDKVGVVGKVPKLVMVEKNVTDYKLTDCNF
ncbi:MAG: hypothetical protein QXL67_02440, partial [Candidatus Bathyarchaeia archaeon]